MQDQKLENLLNLALDATPRERERSLVLDVGFEPEERRWDLIVKYSGSLQGALNPEIRAVEQMCIRDRVYTDAYWDWVSDD